MMEKEQKRVEREVQEMCVCARVCACCVCDKKEEGGTPMLSAYPCRLSVEGVTDKDANGPTFTVFSGACVIQLSSTFLKEILFLNGKHDFTQTYSPML